jgi:hypothetical protein
LTRLPIFTAFALSPLPAPLNELSIQPGTCELSALSLPSFMALQVINPFNLPNWDTLVLAEGKLIYSKDENRRIEFETQVRKAYFDFLPVIRLHRNAYREKVFLELESGISR